MNKVDCLTDEALLALRAEQPEAWFLSAKRPADVADLRHKIIAFFESSYVHAEVLVPFSEQRLAGGNARHDERTRHPLRRGRSVRGRALRGRRFGSTARQLAPRARSP